MPSLLRKFVSDLLECSIKAVGLKRITYYRGMEGNLEDYMRNGGDERTE